MPLFLNRGLSLTIRIDAERSELSIHSIVQESAWYDDMIHRVLDHVSFFLVVLLLVQEKTDTANKSNKWPFT